MKVDTSLTKENKGDTRTKTVYAYLPTTLDNSDSVWLVDYTIEETVFEGVGGVLYWEKTRKFQDDDQ